MRMTNIEKKGIYDSVARSNFVMHVRRQCAARSYFFRVLHDNYIKWFSDAKNDLRKIHTAAAQCAVHFDNSSARGKKSAQPIEI